MVATHQKRTCGEPQVIKDFIILRGGSQYRLHCHQHDKGAVLYIVSDRLSSDCLLGS